MRCISWCVISPCSMRTLNVSRLVARAGIVSQWLIPRRKNSVARRREEKDERVSKRSRIQNFYVLRRKGRWNFSIDFLAVNQATYTHLCRRPNFQSASPALDPGYLPPKLSNKECVLAPGKYGSLRGRLLRTECGRIPQVKLASTTGFLWLLRATMTSAEGLFLIKIEVLSLFPLNMNIMN
jgi:hypothetical protein